MLRTTLIALLSAASTWLGLATVSCMDAPGDPAHFTNLEGIDAMQSRPPDCLDRVHYMIKVSKALDFEYIAYLGINVKHV